LSPPSGSLVYEHSIAGTGPDAANDAKFIASSGTGTLIQSSTATLAGDNVGFQLNLSPLP